MKRTCLLLITALLLSALLPGCQSEPVLSAEYEVLGRTIVSFEYRLGISVAVKNEGAALKYPAERAFHPATLISADGKVYEADKQVAFDTVIEDPLDFAPRRYPQPYIHLSGCS